MHHCFSVFVVFCICALLPLTLGELSVEVSSSGVYEVLVDGTPWFSGGFQAFHQNGSWYTNGLNKGYDKLAMVGGLESGYGYDSLLGEYNTITITWTAGNIPVITEFKTYQDVEAIVLTQSFPKGVPNSVVGNPNDVVGAFPGFTTISENLFYFTFTGTFSYPVLGKWGTSPPTSFGIQEGNPILFYNETLRTFMISPLNNFMVSENTVSEALGAFSVGLQGMIESIPPGFSHSTLFYAGQGINDTFYSWGDILLSYYGKQRAAVDADVVLKYLGYWTDNGGYYWYNPEAGKNYEQTIFDIKAYHEEIGLPINYYQLDSWWYFKENSSEYLSALKLWEPRPDVFPDGLVYVSEKIGRPPLALHNRHFSAVNDYIQNYTFVVETALALPIDENMFLHIMGLAQEWGLQVYEQDWMVTTYTEMKATQNNVYNSRTWLKAMGNAAQQLGLTIQYCMDLPIMVLQSVEIPVVTQIRASIDYQLEANQWQVAYTGLFLWSLGTIPYKDDFWTTSYQPGCVFANTNCTEPNPYMQALVASLSAGPVGPSDKIGATNKTLVMKTCAQNGLLIKPDKPSTPLDQVFIEYISSGQMIQVWDTFSQYGQNRWHYVFGAALTAGFSLESSFIGLNGTSSVIYDYVQVSETYQNSSTQNITLFDDTHPYNIPAKGTSSTGVVGFSYLVIAPILEGVDWILLGEVDKFIPVSHQRITSLTAGQGQLSAAVSGSFGESVNFLFSQTSDLGSVVIVTCSILQNGTATLTCGDVCVCS